MDQVRTIIINLDCIPNGTESHKKGVHQIKVGFMAVEFNVVAEWRTV